MRYKHSPMIQKHLVLICLAIALVLLIVSASLYPGGSQANLQTQGYDMVNNYLCNLFDAKGMNGAPNPGMQWAFAGMLIMCVGFGLFFYRVSAKIPKRSSALIIRYAGMAAMFFAFLVITPYHDMMVTIAVIFAMLSTVYLAIYVFISGSWPLRILSLFCMISLYFSAIIYYTKYWLEILPLSQKINYLLLIIWVLFLEYFTTAADFMPKGKS